MFLYNWIKPMNLEVSTWKLCIPMNVLYLQAGTGCICKYVEVIKPKNKNKGKFQC